MQIKEQNPLWTRELTFVSAMFKKESHGYTFFPHQHPFFEIGILAEGKSQWIFDETESIDLNPNEAILLPPGQIHREHAPEPVPVTYFFVCFKLNDNDSEFSFRNKKPVRLGDNATEVTHIFHSLIKEQSQQAPARDEYLAALVRQLLILIDRSASVRSTGEDVECDLNQYQKGIVISSARAFCDGPFTSGFVSEMARHFDISLPYFSSLFKSYHGISPREFIQQQRMNRAKELLQNSNLRIKEIAFELDFNNSVHFCHNFKKACGLSPRNFRNSATCLTEQ